MDPPTTFNDEFLDDFFAECDEHLIHIRQVLVLLEPSIGKAQVEISIVQELFRDFHSLKGISAIVGLRTAEELAHGTEDYLRELSRGKISLTAEGLDLLMTSAQRLEQIVSAFRAKQPIPDNALVLNRFREISEISSGTELGAKKPKTGGALETGAVGAVLSDEARARGLVLWKFTFTPSRELDQTGININSVRAKLSCAGEILRALPQVRGEGVVVFEFLVGMKETPADITAWEAEGLVAELLEPPAPAAPDFLHSPRTGLEMEA
ncbi:MAG TPA: Hpt domain-containing protein, partial [Verrucomicrobiae bacterium]|nr:Hpt domain-containing protein [Verrucomicrobiae bacterium]